MNTGTKGIAEDIRKALDAATPGPWTINPYNNDEIIFRQKIICMNNSGHEDARLIANAPTWLRSLLEEDAGNQQMLAMQKDVIQQLQQENERLREALIKERDDAMIWDGITVVDRINKVLSQYAINESKPDTATTSLG